MMERNFCYRFPAQDPLARGDCQIRSAWGKIDPSRALAGDDADTPVAGPDGPVSPQDSPGVDGSIHDIERAVFGFGTARSNNADLGNRDDRSRTELGNL
jgi:hypothetical protein